jgi:predicted ArsR family transcriptional regulator
MKITCRELSRILEVDYLQASNLLKVLTNKGIAEEADTNRTSKRGRPTIVYSVPDNITINLSSGQIKEEVKCQNTT